MAYTYCFLIRIPINLKWHGRDDRAVSNCIVSARGAAFGEVYLCLIPIEMECNGGVRPAIQMSILDKKDATVMSQSNTFEVFYNLRA